MDRSHLSQWDRRLIWNNFDSCDSGNRVGTRVCQLAITAERDDNLLFVVVYEQQRVIV